MKLKLALCGNTKTENCVEKQKLELYRKLKFTINKIKMAQKNLDYKCESFVATVDNFFTEQV